MLSIHFFGCFVAALFSVILIVFGSDLERLKICSNLHKTYNERAQQRKKMRVDKMLTRGECYTVGISVVGLVCVQQSEFFCCKLFSIKKLN